MLYKIFLALVIFSSALRAEELPEHFVPVRPKALGGAYTAVANDENAVWTNPAGISRIRKARARKSFSGAKFPNIGAGINTSAQGFYSGVKDAAQGDTESLAKAAPSLAKKPFWAQASAFPLVGFKSRADFLMGPFMHVQTRGQVDQDNPEFARINVVGDVGGVFDIALADKSNRYQIGLGLRSIQRYSYEDAIAIKTIADQTKLKQEVQKNASKSTGLGVDLGFMMTLADFWYPTFGLAILNAPLGCKDDYLNPFTKLRGKVCGTKFKGNFANPDSLATLDPTDIRMGLSITPRFGRELGGRLALDVHHFPVETGSQTYGLAGVDAIKLLHFGAELFLGNPLLPSPFAVSGGIHQGFIAFGVSSRLGFFSLDIATYGKDISSTATQLEDRRIVATTSFDF